jgi:hypothetical protein
MSDDEHQDAVDREALGLILMIANDDDSAVRDKLATFIEDPERVIEMLRGTLTVSGVLMQVAAMLLKMSSDDIASMMLEVM